MDSETKEALEIIRNWEKLTGWEKFWRDSPKPSVVDYRLVNLYIENNRLKNGVRNDE